LKKVRANGLLDPRRAENTGVALQMAKCRFSWLASRRFLVVSTEPQSSGLSNMPLEHQRLKEIPPDFIIFYEPS
jgi:hypothetical protein